MDLDEVSTYAAKNCPLELWSKNSGLTKKHTQPQKPKPPNPPFKPQNLAPKLVFIFLQISL